MAHFETRIRTPWPAEKAFSYLADLSNFEDWDPGTKRAALIAGEPGALGSRYEIQVGAATLVYEIIEREAGSHVRAKGRSSLVTSIDTIDIDAEPHSSVVTYDARVTLSGPLGLLDPLFAILFRRMGEKAADSLVEKLDGERLS